MPGYQKKVLTNEEKFKLELQAETALLRFQRQYKILEKDRSSVFVNSSGILGKQKKVIKILRRESNEILTDVAVACSEFNSKQDQRVSAHLRNLLKDHNKLLDETKREKAFLNELDMQITIVKKSIVELRSKSITEIQCTQKVWEGQRTLEALENKLEMATKRFCTTLTTNIKLRDEIDHLLKERAHFNKSWDKLVTHLASGKKYMLDLIEQATIAYDQREEWCQKLATLRFRAHAEFIMQSQEMTEIQRRIDHESKLETFIATKGQKRVMKNLLHKRQKKRDHRRQEMEFLLQKYTYMLDEIKDFTNESEFEGIGKTFAETETGNFAMFQYINELNNQLESLSDELFHLQYDIDEQRRFYDLRNHQQKKRLEDLEIELEKCTLEAEDSLITLKSTENTLEKLLKGISWIFSFCKCSKAPLLELLGDNSTINLHNALLYLNVLENRINEMIISMNYSEKKAGDKKKGGPKVFLINNEKIKHHIITLEEMVAKDPCPLCVEQTLVSDVIDTLQKVMDKDQIRDKLEESISRGFTDIVHNVSGCHLPKSRAIIQRRYQ